MGSGIKGIGILILGLLALLCGCSSKEPYQQRKGVWYFNGDPVLLNPGERLTPLIGAYAKSQQSGFYRGTRLLGSDGKSFEALSDHYAKDQAQVYYCDAYRDGQDYFLIQRTRIKPLKADTTSFRYLKTGYARDARKMFFEGVEFGVKHIDSFEILDYGFARDKITGYYHQTLVPGSDGSSFAFVDSRYSKDVRHVYYSYFDTKGKATPKSVRIEGALVGSFVSLEGGYAKDAGRAYYEGKPLARAASFEVLALDYAKTDTQVFYRGKLVVGADALSFKMLETISDQADATDKNSSYKLGKKSASK